MSAFGHRAFRFGKKARSVVPMLRQNARCSRAPMSKWSACANFSCVFSSVLWLHGVWLNCSPSLDTGPHRKRRAVASNQSSRENHDTHILSSGSNRRVDQPHHSTGLVGQCEGHAPRQPRRRILCFRPCPDLRGPRWHANSLRCRAHCAWTRRSAAREDRRRIA